MIHDNQPNMNTPLVTIQFVWTDWRVGVVTEAELDESRRRGNDVEPLVEGEVVLTRHWYHVPRLKDHVRLTRVADEEPFPIETFGGIVRLVEWSDDGVRIEISG